MGVDLGPQGQGGRRSVDAELNLIPFIDLLSVTILLLLMTAVWVEISKMSAFSQPGGESIVRHSDVSTTNAKRENRDWDVLVRTQGVEIRDGGRSLGTFAVADAKEAIEKFKSQLGDTSTAKVSLRAADDVVYEDVVSVLDALFTSKIMNVSIGGM